MESRHNIDRQSDETSKSGTDDAVAQQATAFDPSKSNDPGKAREIASRESEWSNPLDASPANTDMSKGSDEVEGRSKKKRAVKGKSMDRNQSRVKEFEAGFEKKVVAGTAEKQRKQDKERPRKDDLIKPGSR